MLLVVDVGNTQTHLGVIDGGAVVDEWRIATVRHRTSETVRRPAAGLLLPAGPPAQGGRRRGRYRLRGPTSHAAVGGDVRKHLGIPAFVVGPGARTGMRIRTRNPSEVGADRIVNAVAAFEMYGGPCIVADYGTATTFDVISAEGDYLGGAIAPGIEVSLEALTSRAAKLIKVKASSPSTPSASRPPRRWRPAPSMGSPARWRAWCTPSGQGHYMPGISQAVCELFGIQCT